LRTAPKSESILVATSIAPGARLEVQQRAVESWLRAGFDVTSLNVPEEIDQLRPDFPGIDFAPILRTAKPIVGKPLVFITDMVDFLRRSDRKVVGIINSDIHIAESGNLPSFIASRVSEGFIFGPRVEVPSFIEGTGELDPKLDPWGFDFFFFDRHLPDVWGEKKFCLGMPFWDQWFPLMPLLAGRPTLKLISNAFRHIPHDTHRDQSFFMFADEFMEAVLPEMGGTAEYLGLKKDVAIATADEEQRIRSFEAMAQLIDATTQRVIRLLDQQCPKLYLEAELAE